MTENEKKKIIIKANKEIQGILKKNRLIVNYVMEFPIYRKLPDEAALALKILNRHEMKIRSVLVLAK